MAVKILSVDDSKTIRLIISRAFKTYDCQVLEASNGLEGMAVATREKPDVIILDVTMPIMDGMEMLSMLRASHELRNIPVVMLTAEAGRDTVLRIAKMGVRDYLIKPFKEEQIIERVSRIVPLEAATTAGKPKKLFDDALKLLIVDDKTAIIDQIRTGLADTPWKLEGVSEAHNAIVIIEKELPDAVFVSTTLPDNTAMWLTQKLRSNARTQGLPIFALMVKTALMDQTRAQQLGFTNVVTKPIDYLDMKTKVARALKLDASYRYFNQRDNVLWVKFPEAMSSFDFNEITTNLGKKVSDAVDSGLDKVVIDIRELKRVEMAIVELCFSVVKTAQDLSMRVDFLGNPYVQGLLNQYHETKAWHFFETEEAAIQYFTAQKKFGAGTEPPPPTPQ
jgi:two-component system cell cycle response regulator